MKIGYHASHEQFAPSELLTYAIEAERAGFEDAMCSDHLFPWSEAQGHSGFAFAWLGAAMQATSLSFGVVSAPGYRMHPVITAQACATLAQMFPHRFWVAIGSGEALNEHVTGEPWPNKKERNARLRESVDVIRRLWNGEWVSHEGRIRAKDAKLWSLPEAAPLVIAPVLTVESASAAGEWADGLITVSQERSKLAQIVEAFRSNGGRDKPLFLQAKLSYSESEERALEGAMEQWRSNILPSHLAADLALPREFEARTRDVTEEQLRDAVRVSSSLDQHLRWLQEDAEMGFAAVYLHNVNREQSPFIEAFGREVLPVFR